MYLCQTFLSLNVQSFWRLTYLKSCTFEPQSSWEHFTDKFYLYHLNLPLLRKNKPCSLVYPTQCERGTFIYFNIYAACSRLADQASVFRSVTNKMWNNKAANGFTVAFENSSEQDAREKKPEKEPAGRLAAWGVRSLWGWRRTGVLRGRSRIKAAPTATGETWEAVALQWLPPSSPVIIQP